MTTIAFLEKKLNSKKIEINLHLRSKKWNISGRSRFKKLFLGGKQNFSHQTSPIIIIFTYRHIILFRFIRALSKLKVIQLFMMLMKREVAVGRSDFLQCANKAYCCFAFLYTAVFFPFTMLRQDEDEFAYYVSTCKVIGLCIN
jgi:hypothetical protein